MPSTAPQSTRPTTPTHLSTTTHVRRITLQVELYLSLGTLLEASDRGAALQLYLQFPRPEDDASATFDHATLATCAVWPLR